MGTVLCSTVFAQCASEVPGESFRQLRLGVRVQATPEGQHPTLSQPPGCFGGPKADAMGFTAKHRCGWSGTEMKPIEKRVPLPVYLVLSI